MHCGMTAMWLATLTLFSLNKALIPVVPVQGYQADGTGNTLGVAYRGIGWLGALVGNVKELDFGAEAPFDEAFNELLEALKQNGRHPLWRHSVLTLYLRCKTHSCPRTAHVNRS